jgi:hypothetical protein
LVTLRSLVTAHRDLRQSHRIRLLSEVVLTGVDDLRSLLPLGFGLAGRRPFHAVGS